MLLLILPGTVPHQSNKWLEQWRRARSTTNHWNPTNMSESLFSRVANATARGAGKPIASILAVTAVVVWAISGPWLHFGETCQLVINTCTTIITMLMDFLIQHTQNNDTAAVHIKLDEIICVLKKADNSLLDLEHADIEELDRLQGAYAAKATAAKQEAGLDKA
jgi:low affinity Fe/Cu permease